MATLTGFMSPDSFTTFGDLLRYLRRRARLTQLELSIAVGYSEGQISRLEKNQRLPDLTALKALFIPALHIEQEPELAARLLALAESARQEDAPAPGFVPYKGLEYFDEQDADWFFGRESLTAHLVDCVKQLTESPLRLLAIVGASGSGKSSVVRAGLAVTLKRAGWQTRIFTPTAQPVQTLATVNRRPPSDVASHRIDIIDQFEEVFTLCRDESARATFVERLIALANRSDEPTTIAVVLRADFYSHCAQYPELRQAIAAQQEYIGQMTREELRRAIEEPAKRSNWEFEPGLVELMLSDVGAGSAQDQEPGALPLLSHALLATWERRRGRTLTLEGYRAAGGVRGAIAETAESVFTDQLNEPQQQLARAIFLRLTELGEGTEDTRRRAALTELVPTAQEALQVRAVLNTLADARLVSLGEDSAEVAHEALIREWQRLREWLNQDRDGLRLHRQLMEAASEWEGLHRDAGALYRGARLAQVLEWRGVNEHKLNDLERAFLDASSEQEQSELREKESQRQRELQIAQKLAQQQQQRAEEQARTAKRLRQRSYILASAFILAIGLALLALFLGRQAQKQERIATARELAAGAISDFSVNAERSILLALRAVETTRQADGTVLPEAEDALHRAVLASRLRLTLRGHAKQVNHVAFSADGTRVLTSDPDLSRIWDTASGKLLYTVPGFFGGNASRDPSRFVTLERDENRMTLHFWDASTGTENRSTRFEKPASQFYTAAVSPDLTRFAVGYRDGTLEIRDAASGQTLLKWVAHTAAVNNLIFSSDGKWVASSNRFEDSTVNVWDVLEGKQILSLPVRDVYAMKFTPDGSRLVTAADDNIARVWQVSSGKELFDLYGHTNSVDDIDFSPDGTRIATASWDGTAIVWDAASGRPLFIMSGHENRVMAIAYSPDGHRIVTGSRDNTAKVWDATPNNEVFSVDTGGRLSRGSIDPTGTRLVTGGRTVKVWDISHAFDAKTPGVTLRMTLRDIRGNIDPEFSPDGRMIATGTFSSTLFIWNAESGKQIMEIPFGPSQEDDIVAYSPDGARIALSARESKSCCVRIWDIRDGKLILKIDSGKVQMTGLAFTPDGKQLVIANDDGTISLRDAASGNLLSNIPAHTIYSWDVRYSPDGKRVLTSSSDGTAKVWDATTWKEIFTLRHTSTVERSEYSPDGTRIVTASNDGTAKIWDAATGKGILTLYGSTTGLSGAFFSPDGTHVITTSSDGAMRVYLVRLEDLVELAKTRVTRSLTTDECQKFLHSMQCPP